MRPRRRSWLMAYFVEPFSQIRFGLHVVVVCLAYIILIGVIFAKSFYDQYEQVMSIFGVADMQDRMDLLVNEVFLRNAVIVGCTLVAMAGTVLFVVVLRTHRMYGPMIAINRFVGELRKGNFAARIAVRKKDDFKSLVEQLNSLAENLHRTYGVQKVTATGDLDRLDQRVDQSDEGVVNVTEPGENPESVRSRDFGKAS